MRKQRDFSPFLAEEYAIKNFDYLYQKTIYLNATISHSRYETNC